MTTETVFPSVRDFARKERSGEDVQSGATSPVRPEWLFSLMAACQRLAGATSEADRTRFLEAFENFARELPLPESAVERLMLHQCALSSFLWAGHQFHRDFHARVRPGDCAAGPIDRVIRRCRGPFDHPPDVRRWAAEFLDAFHLEHHWPVAARAASLLQRRFAVPLDVPWIARELGCSRTILMTSFADAFGMTMTAYIRRLRIRRSIASFRDRESNVAAVAREVGYESTKNLYRALKQATGLTPTQIRDLSHDEFRSLLDSLPEPSFLRPWR
jgi:AraC-like DNA-binding protein